MITIKINIPSLRYLPKINGDFNTLNITLLILLGTKNCKIKFDSHDVLDYNNIFLQFEDIESINEFFSAFHFGEPVVCLGPLDRQNSNLSIWKKIYNSDHLFVEASSNNREFKNLYLIIPNTNKEALEIKLKI